MSEEGITDACLYAWTSAGDYRSYPQYVNLSRKGGKLVLSVRSLEDLSGEHPAMGAQASAELPGEEAIRLANVIRQSSLPPVKGTIVERLTNEIEMMEMLYADHCSLSVNELRDIRAAIESMPIQKMVEGLERARQNIQSLHQATYGFGNAELVERWCAQIDSLLASVQSDGDGV